MKIKTTRHMDAGKVRGLCIRQDYFTCGNNEQYDQFLNECNICPTDSDILVRAEIIMRYSDTEKMMRQYGCDEKGLLETICFNLANDCCWYSIELSE